MRLIIGSLIFLSLVNCIPAQNKLPVPFTGKNLYLLLDERWCAYSSEEKWKSEVQSLQALTVAKADYANGRMTALYVTEQEEAGDWIIYDTYSLDKAENQNLKRIINYLPGRLSEEEIWLIRDGRAIKQRSTHRSLATLEPIPLTEEALRDMSLPEEPVITTLPGFPFWPLLRDQGAAIVSKGKVCIPEK